MFLCLFSYLILFVKTPLHEINIEIQELIQNETCAENTLFCSSPTFSKQSWSILQSFVNIWVFMFAVEEFRQVRNKNY